jgi:rubrerythrin
MSKANYPVALLIAANAQDENEAIEGYLKLLEVLTDPQDIAQIEEIISDEKEHAHRLADVMLKYDGGIEEADD